MSKKIRNAIIREIKKAESDITAQELLENLEKHYSGQDIGRSFTHLLDNEVITLEPHWIVKMAAKSPL